MDKETAEIIHQIRTAESALGELKLELKQWRAVRDGSIKALFTLSIEQKKGQGRLSLPPKKEMKT